MLNEKTNAHSNYIASVAFSPDGTKIVSGSNDGTIKVWDADSFNLLETRLGEAKAFSKEAEGVVRDGATIRMKDGGGAFYAPSPILCVAVSWPRIAAGAQSGELNHLEVMWEQRIATRNQLPVKTHDKNLKNSTLPRLQHLAAVCHNPRGGDSRKKGLRFGPVRITRRRVSFGLREIPLNMSQLKPGMSIRR